jgi:L-arabinose isomerase
MKVARFGDNMRQVAVTDGDKVAAEMKFGFSVNTHGVGELVKVINQISENEIDNLVKEYEATYEIMPSLTQNGNMRSSLVEAARIEMGLKAFLEDGNFSAYTNTFEDLHGMRQLPGIGSQRMMAAGYGFGGEGDWKTSAMVHIMKTMATGLKGGNSFMEDYTYHFDPQNPFVLGSHMLEICPTIAKGKVNCEVHPLGIGGKENPVRLVFDVPKGPAINVSLIDLGNRFRLIVNEVEAIEITEKFPKLPTARALWKPQPNMEIGLQAWLLAGGAHHTVYSQNITTEYLEDFAEMLDIELVVIDKNTTIRGLKSELRYNEIAFK